jgi:hypothetical protein
MLCHWRWQLLGALLGANLLPALVFAALRHDGPIDPDDYAYLVMHMVLTQMNMFICGAAVFAAQDKPSRLFAFPIANTTLVTWQIAPAMVVIALQSLASTCAINALFGLNWPYWGPALFMAVGLAATDAVLWQTEKTGWVVLGLTGVGGALGLWYKSRFGPVFSQATHMWTAVTPGEMLTMLATVVVAWWAAVKGIARNRRGDQIPPLGIMAWLDRVFDRAPGAGLPFRTPLAAQFWFEWRQKGWALPACVALWTLLGMCGWLVFSRRPPELFEGFVAGGGLLSVAGMVIGLIMGNTGPNDANFEMGSFLAARPITNRDLSRTILRTALQSVLAAWALWAGSFVVVYLILLTIGGLPAWTIPEKIGWWYFPATLLGPWIVVAGGASLGLTGRGTLIVKSLSALIALLLAALIFPKFCLAPRNHALFRDCAAGLASGVVLLVTVWCYVAACRRELVSARLAWIAAGVWCVLASIVVADWVQHPHDPVIHYAFALAALALGVAPLAAAPLALVWNRHR